MAYYKVGHKILNEQEYEQQTNEVWSFWLFILGAFIIGGAVLQQLPTDWSKELRYGLVLISGFGAGLLLGRLASIVRTIFFISIFIVLLAFGLQWLWVVV
tara:strand:+ start:1665 stop:1964 length:300 start_codon:yes stop_codon:yes gene_type:complete